MSETHTLRIFHLSDLHERGPREEEAWRRQRVLGDTWKRNLDSFLADGPVDLVCCTGDVADWGQTAEYEAAAEFFQALMRHQKLPIDKLFLVPGNHDITRKIHRDSWEKLRLTFRQGDGLTLSRWLVGTGKPPTGAEAAWLEPVLERQAAYQLWLKDLGRTELDPTNHAHGRVGYRVSFNPDNARSAKLALPESFPSAKQALHSSFPFPIHLIGLDTAWLAGDNEDAQKLWLTDDQIMRHATGPDGKSLPGLRIALCHHPLWDLADHDRAANLLAQHTDLLLRGHLHKAKLERRSDPDRGLVELAAGCLFEGCRADHYPNSCQLLTLRLNEQGRLLSVEPWFRSWSEQGHWHDDDSRYEKTQQGRVLWPCLPPPPANGSNPYDVAHPATPPAFVGRTALLDSLAQAIERTASVSIVGNRRIGKSSLLLTFQAKAKAMGREVRWLSGEEGEATSLSAFIAKITGTPCDDNPEVAANALSAWAGRVGRPGLAPVLLLDEAEIFLRQFDYRFFERLRGMLERVCVILATHKPIDEVFLQLGLGSPFDNKLLIENVGLLEPWATEQLLQRGGNLLDGEDLALMRRWAGRHPYYLQLLGFRLLEARRHGDTRQTGLDKARQDAHARLRTLWPTLRKKEQQALRMAASGQPPANSSRLRLRGLLEENGLLFGEVLAEWLEEEDEA